MKKIESCWQMLGQLKNLSNQMKEVGRDWLTLENIDSSKKTNKQKKRELELFKFLEKLNDVYDQLNADIMDSLVQIKFRVRVELTEYDIFDIDHNLMLGKYGKTVVFLLKKSNAYNPFLNIYSDSISECLSFIHDLKISHITRYRRNGQTDSSLCFNGSNNLFDSYRLTNWVVKEWIYIRENEHLVSLINSMDKSNWELAIQLLKSINHEQ